MADFTGFEDGLFAFLGDLGRNNNKEWFESNRERYIRYAKEPTLAFIAAMKERLERISPSYVADTRANGGSMFRIYRDTRFSKDKRPYKVNVGCQFRHAAGRDAHAPGFYLHLQPGESFVGGGIWAPPAAVLARIREAIDEKQDEWRRVRKFLADSRNVGLRDAERYKRPPRGFEPDHPFIEDIKLKTFFAGRDLSDSEVTAPGFIDKVEEAFGDLVPLMRFINEALELSF